jgi:hypothetical protein
MSSNSSHTVFSRCLIELCGVQRGDIGAVAMSHPPRCPPPKKKKVAITAMCWLARLRALISFV